MKKYTQEEFDALPVDEFGYKRCPTGDYTAINNFPAGCIFDILCRFGKGCNFGELCRFGKGCNFGELCRFGDDCSFGVWCSFGECCSFGPCCEFSHECHFGERCRFDFACNFCVLCSFGECCEFSHECRLGAGCSFGVWCSFGERCSFGNDCKFNNCACEFGVFSEMINFGGFGSEHRTTYAFKLDDGGIGVRCGCFAGNLEEFKNKVKNTHGDTKLAKEYLMVADLIEFKFNN